ncbi:MAG: hypothetical protein JWN71_1273 [Xanthobacteraceae bacterium]|nr:hypothetical protein [Xanthobacteraceae bacterium]
MTRKRSLFLRYFGTRSLRAILGGVIGVALVLPAAAQRFEERFPGDQRRRPPAPIPQQERPSGFQFPFFGGFSAPSRPSFFDPAPQQQRQAPAADFSRAPPPTHKGDTSPTSNIVVLGDSMADWLAYGLEDILSDMPEVGVVRKLKTHSGLVRYDTKAEPPDWAVAARDILAAEKPTAIVMMVGSNDRLPLRDAPEKPEKPASDTPSIAAPEKKNAAGASHEFQSEKWTELYTKRIDDTMTALKARGVPVFWVGLPSQRSPRATADALFLNDLYRGRAEKAGIVYVDIWDGFVNEAGKFTIFGPDFEGQNRRLRAGDGVHFTKAGAQKLAHYVDREIKRAIQNRLLPVALPAQDEPSTPSAPTVARPGGPAPRPIAGPVVPLSAPPPSGEELLGGNSSRAPAADPLVTRVLVKGDAPPVSAGRADDYSWPPGSALAAAPAAAPLPAEVTTSTVNPTPERAPPVAAVRRPAATETPATPSARVITAPAPGSNPSAVKPPPARTQIRRAPIEADAHPDAVRPIAPTAPTTPRPVIRRAPPPADTGDAPRPPAPVGRAAFAPWGAER